MPLIIDWIRYRMAKLQVDWETCWYQSKKLIVQAWLSTHINGSNEFEWCQERGITNVIFHSILFFSPWMVSGVRGEVAESPHSLLVLQTVHFQPLPPFSTGAYGIISSFPSCLFPSLSSFFLFLHFYCYPLSPFLLLTYTVRKILFDYVAWSGFQWDKVSWSVNLRPIKLCPTGIRSIQRNWLLFF